MTTPPQSVLEKNAISDKNWQTLNVQKDHTTTTLTFHRPERQNAFNGAMLGEIQRVLDLAEADSNCRIIVLKGENGFFCKGLDLEDVFHHGSEGLDSAEPYMTVLRRLTLIPRIVVAVVDGQAMAGGLGFVAASDLVLATSRSKFSLPEPIFGLVPACVGLYLTRRIGVRGALKMSLTSETVAAAKALTLGLVDEVTDTPETLLARLSVHAARLQDRTIRDIKRFFREIDPIDASREQGAVAETHRLMQDSSVRAAIAGFVRDRRFPWEIAPSGPGE